VAVTVSAPIDPVQLEELQDAGYTTLTLWVANTPDGAYTNSGVTPSPATIALMESGENFTATFTYSGGTVAQWGKIRGFDGSNYTPLADAVPFHFGGGTTLTRVRQLLGKEIRDLRTGTATTSTDANTVITSTPDIFRWQTGTFNNAFLHNTTRSGWAQITSSTKGASTTTIELGANIASQATGDSFEITKRWTPDEYRDAINWAIVSSYPWLARQVTNTGLMTADQVFRHQVPHDIKSVLSVEIETDAHITSESQATRGHPWIDVPFAIRKEGLLQYIELETPYTPNRRLRVTGIGPLSQLYNESDYVEEMQPQVELLVYLAAFRLFRNYVNDAASSDIDRYEALAGHYMGLCEKFKQAHQQSRPARRWWSSLNRGNPHHTGTLGSWSGSSFDT